MNGVERIRERWESSANRALERADHEARTDRRSLAAQGAEREPTIHLGPRGQHVDKTVLRPESKPLPAPRRPERNAEISDLNLENVARSPDHEPRL